MKGSSLRNFIVAIVAVSLAMFTYVVTLTEIKRINKEKIYKQQVLNERRNRIEAKAVEIQKLTSEDRIVKFAQDSLGMIRPGGNLDAIQVSKEQIKQIEKLVNDKYD